MAIFSESHLEIDSTESRYAEVLQSPPHSCGKFLSKRLTDVTPHFDLQHKAFTDKILHGFFKVVHAELGYGFLEKVYENAMVIFLRSMGLEVRNQEKIDVLFSSLGVAVVSG